MQKPSGARVAVAADDAGLRDRLLEVLGGDGYEPMAAGWSSGSLQAASSPEILVWALSPEQANSAQPLQALRQMDLAQLPIILIYPAGLGSLPDPVAAGADRVLTLPLDPSMLLRAVGSLHKYVDMRRRLERRRRMEEADELDPVTGLGNPAGFRRTLDAEFTRLERYPGVLSLIMLQLDGFDVLVKEHGTAAANQCLLLLGGAIAHGIRQVDFGSRLEGSRFSVLLPMTDLEAAGRVANRLQQMVSGLIFRPEAVREATGSSVLPLVKLTASFGVAAFPGAGITGKGPFQERARAALERARASGGGRVVFHAGGETETLQGTHRPA